MNPMEKLYGSNGSNGTHATNRTYAMSARSPVRPICLALTIALLAVAARAQDPPSRPNPFALARQAAAAQQTMQAVTQLFAEQNWAEAEKILLAATSKDANSVDLYNLACAQARQGKSAAALDSLEAAVEKGFNRPTDLTADADLAVLRKEERFQAALEKAQKLAAQPPAPAANPEPQLVGADGIATVGPENTVYLPQFDLFQAWFRFADDDPRIKLDAVKGHGRAGDLIRKWQKEGSAAGLFGFLYDNHDRDHSNLPANQFPQLTSVEWSPEAKADTLDHGLAARVFFNRPTIGNSSTAIAAGPIWRSQTRMAQVQPRSIAIQYEQYVKNQLYFYPEHRDYDAGHNGKPDGYGDVFPANSPYVVTSFGSSGSDQSFMHAVACTLAAFRPKTQEKLIERGLLMPTVQMILRRTAVASDAEYLTGKAHPVVFREDQLHVEQMVELAHDLQSDVVPPMIQLKVVREDVPRPGIDFFEPAGIGDRIFDTPAAIARVYRTTARERRMVVTAATSFDANNHPLKFHWAVLQGKASRVQIVPLKDDGSLVELVVQWHERFPSASDPKLETNRVEIAAFAHNGHYYSAPGFVTICCLDDEERKFGEQGRLESITYRSPAQGGNYADPLIHTLRDWRDDYHYDSAGKLVGWTRVRGPQQRETFTAHGHLITQVDAKGRALKARKISYVARTAPQNPLPRLEETTGDELKYAYDSDDDRVGHVLQPTDAKSK